MRHKLLAFGLIIIAFIAIISAVSRVTSAASSSVKPSLLWALGAEEMERLKIVAAQVSMLRFSGDSSRLFLMMQPFGHEKTMLTFDVRSGGLLKETQIDADEISNFWPDTRGTKAVIVANYGAIAKVYDIEKPMSYAIYDKAQGERFRFMTPVSMGSAKEELMLARGYFLSAKGETEGDYIVSLDPSLKSKQAVRKQIDLGALLGKAGGKGTLTNCAVSNDMKTAVFAVTKSFGVSTLYVAELKQKGACKAVDGGKDFSFLSLSADGERAVYQKVTADDRPALTMLMTRSGDRKTIADGKFVGSSISLQGDRIMTSSVDEKLFQKLYIARESHDWRLESCDLGNFAPENFFFGMAADGRTFYVWAKERISVCRL
jgi:hypothetical protein